MHRQAELLLQRIERWWALSLVMAIAATAACLAVGGVTPRLMPAAFGRRSCTSPRSMPWKSGAGHAG
ncbi:MAG: hypothetical protein IPP98_09685 [Gemmatimonadetes bacterium]|nr:hypothetical protein [Gemmatimonadota bacterium]